MTATDELLDTGYPNSLRPELHKALKARGIDYWVAQGITFWNRDDGCECLAYGYQVDGVLKLTIKVVGFTDPAQAIAATLGSGTCHMEYCDELSGDELYPTQAYVCSACRYVTVDGKPNYCPQCGAKVVDG